jgi:hypothetical protein
MIAIVKGNSFLRTLALDMLLTAVVLLVPVISHMTGFPFYVFEPMRLLILSYLIFKGSKNAYFLSLSLPLFSFIFSGHPVLFKMPLVALDLFLNVFFFTLLYKKRFNLYLSVGLSVILSKTVYYSLKYLFVSLGLLANGLFETGIFFQGLNLSILLIIAFCQLQFGNNKKLQTPFE